MIQLSPLSDPSKMHNQIKENHVIREIHPPSLLSVRHNSAKYRFWF